MLHRPLSTGYMAQAEPVCNTTGHDLAVVSSKSSATTKALKAVDLVHGNLGVSRLLPRQAEYLTGASHGYFVAAERLTPDERRQVELGASLGNFHKPFRSDAWLDQLVRQVGLGRLMAAVDRAKPDLTTLSDADLYYTWLDFAGKDLAFADACIAEAARRMFPEKEAPVVKTDTSDQQLSALPLP